VQGVAGRLGISPTDGLADALLDGALDDFTSADLTHASLARSEEVEPDGGVLVVTRRGMVSPFAG
jgi:hypothetical protein